MTNHPVKLCKLSIPSLALFICFTSTLLGQIEVEPAITPPFDPESLIKNVFLGKGIEILNVEFRGDPKAVGYFSNAHNEINIGEGLVLSTGKVFNIPTPNDQEAQTSANDSNITDEELANITTGNLIDVVTYEIEFIPLSDSLEFNYAFASEEFPEYSCNCFNDVFGFFIQGPNDNTWNNIALIPGTNDPVSVRTIHPADTEGDGGGCINDGIEADCGPVNAHLYNDNTGNPYFFFDGYSNILTAKAAVTPCETYRIKLTLADVRDQLYDSAIFFEGKSFGSNVMDVETATLGVDKGIVEGCTEGRINFRMAR